MELAAGRPAGAGQPAGVDQDALEAIRYGWDTAYLIGYDDERGYWAERRDRIGGLLTADAPDALRDAITEDYAVKPVPRNPLSEAAATVGRPSLALTRAPC